MTRPEHINDVIRRLERVAQGLKNAVRGVHSMNISLPTRIVRDHSDELAACARELRGADGAIPTREHIPAHIRQQILMDAFDRAKFCYVCKQCESEVKDRAQMHIDHITPVARGGSNEPDNLRAICALCNLQKGAA